MYSRDPAKMFLTFNVQVYLFLIPPVKLNLGMQIDGRLVVATHLNQSNYVANQQQVLGVHHTASASCVYPKP
jgi:hypothetical protein